MQAGMKQTQTCTCAQQAAQNSRCSILRSRRAPQTLQAQLADRNMQARVAKPMVERMSTLPQLAPPRVPSTSPDGQPTVNAASGADFFTAADSRPVILYDGDCNLCNGGVQFMLDWDKEGLFRLAALQSEAGKALLLRSGREPEDISTIALVTEDRHWIKSQAVLNIAKRMRMPLPVLANTANAFSEDFRNIVYDWVAQNRYQLFGESDTCRLMRSEWRDRFLV